MVVVKPDKIPYFAANIRKIQPRVRRYMQILIQHRHTEEVFPVRERKVKKMTMGDRIRVLRREYGMTQKELGELLGVKNAAVQKYEKGTVTNIKRATLLKLAEIFDTSVEYIVNGNEAPANVIPVADEETVNLPILASVSAGIGCHADSLNYNPIGLEPVMLKDISDGEKYVYLRVTGDSMYPMFIENDLALVRVQSSVDSGSYAVVIIDDSDGVIKKVIYGTDYIELHSINPMYPVRRFEGNDVTRIRIFGLVKECKRKF